MRLVDLVGHRPQATLFARLIRRNRLPQAVLLAGPPGVGRRTLALAIAQARLCSEQVEGDACGCCTACRLLAEGAHPDCTVLADARELPEIPIDTIRDDIVHPAHQSPLMGDHRLFVLPDIERFSGQGSNSLLKVLEEPPAGTSFLMTAGAGVATLATIRSRSQVFRLRALTADEITTILVRQGEQEDAARLAAQSAGGSHRGLATIEGQETPLALLRALALEGFEATRIADLTALLPDRAEDVRGANTTAAAQRLTVGRWLDALVQDLRQDLRRHCDGLLADLIERVLARRGDLRLNIQPRVVLESLGFDR